MASSKRHFHWTKKIATDDESTKTKEEEKKVPKKKPPYALAVSRLRLALAALGKNRSHLSSASLGSSVVGTLFGNRHGHVHFAFQKEAKSTPAFLIELGTPISGLVGEMASGGLVRIALECDKKKGGGGGRGAAPPPQLLEEENWRAYCNGKKSGYGIKRECGVKEWKILKAVEPISMGAGVIPGKNGMDGEEVMYMRARFERVVGSRDSEAFYMMNPDSNGAPELSIYLLRI